MMNPSPKADLALGVAILAAGASTRMGQPKLLLPWGAGSVVEHLLSVWRELGAQQVAVICSAQAQPVQTELDRIRFDGKDRIWNPAPSGDMFSSIQCAARWGGWFPAMTHVALVLGDQPHVRASTLRKLLKFAARHPERVCQPERHRRPRHPVVIPRAVLGELANSNAPDLRHFLQDRADLVALEEIDDPALDLDLDTPADYEAAMRAFASGKGG